MQNLATKTYGPMDWKFKYENEYNVQELQQIIGRVIGYSCCSLQLMLISF